jgi:uncharacterized Ntn-hydrolase superfamily protein
MNSNYKSTFSIVARDPNTGLIAVGGGSHWFAYSTLVPFIKAGVGAIATQAECNVSFGPDGLKYLSESKSAEETLEILLNEEENEDIRQVLVLDNEGGTAAFTGSSCIKYASHISKKNFAVAGNMLANENILSGMDEFFHSSDLPFVLRIIKTLQEAQRLGGDLRGKRSAGLLVAKSSGSENFWEDVIYNLRVDDHVGPFDELERLYYISKAYRYMGKGDDAYYEKKDKPKSLVNYEKAFKLQPNNPEVKFWYAKLLHDMGEVKKSEALRKELNGIGKNWEEYWNRVVK